MVRMTRSIGQLNITMIDVGPIEKIATELHKQGVNLNQLMKFLNTYGIDAYNAEEQSFVS